MSTPNQVPTRYELRPTDRQTWDKFKMICEEHGRSLNVTIDMLIAEYVARENHDLRYPQ